MITRSMHIVGGYFVSFGNVDMVQRWNEQNLLPSQQDSIFVHLCLSHPITLRRALNHDLSPETAKVLCEYPHAYPAEIKSDYL